MNTIKQFPCKYEGLRCYSNVNKRNTSCITCSNDTSKIKYDKIIKERSKLLDGKYNIIETFIGHKNYGGQNQQLLLNNYWLVSDINNDNEQFYAMYCEPNNIFLFSKDSLKDVIKYIDYDKTVKYFTWKINKNNKIECKSHKSFMLHNVIAKSLYNKNPSTKELSKINVKLINDNFDYRIENIEWTPVFKKDVVIDNIISDNDQNTIIDNGIKLNIGPYKDGINYVIDVNKSTLEIINEYYIYKHSYNTKNKKNNNIKKEILLHSIMDNNISIEEKLIDITTKITKFNNAITKLDNNILFDENIQICKNMIENNHEI